MLEFPFETTRAVFTLILSGATTRFVNITWIVSHAGAAIAALATRVAWVTNLLDSPGRGIDVQGELRRLYHDLAGTPLLLLPGLIALVGDQRLLYGSDMTFTPLSATRPLAQELHDSDVLTGDVY